jgi:rSAM/selenodomain-associated transferase 1
MRVVGLFAKQPLPGQVKTRLAGCTSAEWAARVADAFLRDTVERLIRVHARRFVVFSPAEASAFFAALVQDRFALVPQCPGQLGQRMEAFITLQIQAGAEAVVLVGTDSPTLPVSFIEQAFRELGQADVVLGPATDGGYYLIGCGRRVPPVFEGIDWSSSRVLAQTVAALSAACGLAGSTASPAKPQAAEWRLAVLPPWYDVDTLDDWWMLRGHVAALRLAGIDPGLPATEALLEAPS